MSDMYLAIELSDEDVEDMYQIWLKTCKEEEKKGEKVWQSSSKRA